jgi:hypothetical protein
MAEPSIVQGLFGMTPESYQQQRDAVAYQRAAAFGQMDPMQSARTSIFYGANQLGNVAAGMLGAEDPQMRLISQRNALAKQIDMNDPESIMRGAQMAAQSGDTVAASTLADYARKAASDLALIQQRTAEKMTTEQRNALAFAASVGRPGSPEFNRAYQDKFTELTSKAEATTPEMKNAAATAASEFPVGSPQYVEKYREELKRLTTKEPKVGNVKEVGVAMGSREPVYLDVNNDLQYIYQKGADGKQMRVPYFGGVDRTTATTKVQVDAGENEFRKRLGLKDADRVDSAMTLRDSSIAALNSLNRLNQLDQNALISGSFATGRVGATNLLNTLGLTSAKDADSLAKSENYQKTAGDVILATLGGKLGAGFSNDDRKFIQGLVPQLENSPSARKQLIEFMVQKNQSIVDEATRLENYARDPKNNGLRGYVPKIPIINLGANAPKPLSELSNEELMKQFNELKGNKKP